MSVFKQQAADGLADTKRLPNALRPPILPEAEPAPAPAPAPAPVAIREKRALEELERRVRGMDKAQFSHHKAMLRRMMFTIVAETRGIQHWTAREDAVLDANVAWLIELYWSEGASHDIVGETTLQGHADRTTPEDARAADALGKLVPKP